jgi:predicted site-specific integrase-resolvase
MPGEDTTMTDISLQDWLTMKEACTYLDCHPRTIGRYVKLGWLHPRASARNANKYLLSRAEIDAIVALAHTPAE